MKFFLFSVALPLLLAISIVGCGSDKDDNGPGPEAGNNGNLTFIDVQSKANQQLAAPFHGGTKGNDLTALPQGKQTLGSLTFDIGSGVIQLGSAIVKDKPPFMVDIPVNQAFVKLHILHGTGGSGASGRGRRVPDNEQVGTYGINYADGSGTTIPIVYGVDLRDWWNWDNNKPVTRGKVVWTGENAYAKKNGKKLRLYAVTWENPHPEKKVRSIGFFAADDTPCALFCVAMTAER